MVAGTCGGFPMAYRLPTMVSEVLGTLSVVSILFGSGKNKNP